jgi:hypothetical protein
LGTDRGGVVLPAVFLVSAAAIADEIFLIRLLSFRFWPHFVPLVISQAMLGFGASGIAIHLFRAKAAPVPGAVFVWLVALAAPSFDLAFRASQRVPFDPFVLLWDPSAWPAFALLFVVLSVPFFLAGSAVGVPLSFGLGKPGPVYAASFAGAAAGALIALPALQWLPTESLLRVPTALGGAASLLVLIRPGKRVSRARLLLAAGTFALLFAAAPSLRISPFKDLAVARNLPGARVLAVRSGPGGDFRALFAPGIHSAPGLSYRFDGDLPPQAALFADGEFRGIVPQGGGEAPPAYLAFLPWSLPYRLAPGASVLQFSLRGTEGILAAAVNGAAAVTVVEPSPELAAIVGEDLRDFGGGMPASLRVAIRVEGARPFLAREGERFDIVELADVSSATFSALGVHAAGETFLLTREGIRAAFSRTTETGLLAVSGWLKSPPRESVKILRTVRGELERRGLAPASERVLMIRGWGSFSIVAKRTPFTAEEVGAAARFCRETGFDLAWPAGPGKTGDEPEARALAEAVRAALSGPGEEADEGLFDLGPVTDDSPYFYRFLRPGSIPEFRRTLGAQWVPFLEWGVLFLLISLAVSLAAAAAFLFPPLLSGGGAAPEAPIAATLYFSALGLGYMMVEIVFLKLGILLLGNPIVASTAAIGGFALFSGAGSAISGRWVEGGRRRRMLFPCVTFFAAAGYLFLAAAVPHLLAARAGIRTACFLAALAPAAFLMGIPFPAGLLRLAAAGSRGIPFAWAVNGFFSVAGASLASVGALWGGFRGTALVGALLYLAAGAAYPRLGRRRGAERAGGEGS